MKAIPLIFLFALTYFSFGQAQIHEWTNAAGRTIKAKFVRGDAETVTLFMNGRNFVIQLSDLKPESQELARKLSAPTTPSAPETLPSTPANQSGASNSASSTPPAVEKTAGPRGKVLLPTLGSGKWATYHSVLETDNFDVALHGNGHFYLYLKDGGDSLLQGRPLVLKFYHGYYKKPNPRGNFYAYSSTRADLHYYFRKMVGFKNPPKPSEKLGRIELKAELEDGVILEIGFEATSRGVAIWGEADDPSGADHETVLSVGLHSPESILMKDGDGPEQWKEFVDETAIEVKTKAGTRETIPYLEKWVDLKKKLTYHKGIESAFVSGKVFGKRKITIGPKSLRNSVFTVGSYSGVFPLQHHHYILRDLSGGEIDKGRRLEIEIK
tara:strand:- start:109 stop:1254 length:1146 start_codon:yes stop_codon:yes gene_type:complete